jgi:hypothetical protein
MPESVILEFGLPPELGEPSEVLDRISASVEFAETRLAAERNKEGRRVVGARAILRQSWRAMPASSEPRRTRNPRTASRHLASWLLARIRARAFVIAYRVARERWLVGREAVFPQGTYWLSRFAGVRVAAFQT